MRQYLIRRLLLSIPVLLALAVISFALNIHMPGDPVFRALASEGVRMGEDPLNGPDIYKRKRAELGLDKPVFYFSILKATEYDSLFYIPFPQDRIWVQALCQFSTNPESSAAFYHRFSRLEKQLFRQVPDSSRYAVLTFLKELRDEAPENLNENIIAFSRNVQHTHIRKSLLSLNPPEAHTGFSIRNYLPGFHVYGFDNQFHLWLSKIIRMDFGNSFQDGRPIRSILPDALKWTLLLNLLSIVLAYLVAIPAGVYAARHRDTPTERLLTGFWFILYALPGFWTATLLILFFGSGEYLNIFPSGGLMSIQSGDSWPWYRQLADRLHHLILPTFAYAYSAFAYLSGHVRYALLDHLDKEYIRTARAKGLPDKIVVWKHAFRNALLPLITLISQVFPALVSGSIVMETIFSIPGMGLLTWQAIGARDYPLIIAVFMLSGVLTLCGVLIADLLYMQADPRIRFRKQ